MSVKHTVTIDLPDKYYCRELYCNDSTNLNSLHVRVTLHGDGSVHLYVVLKNKIEVDAKILQLNIENKLRPDYITKIEQLLAQKGLKFNTEAELDEIINNS